MPQAPFREQHLSITLGLDISEQPVAGTMLVQRGETRTFSGWFELVSFLEEAVFAARQTNPDGRAGQARGSG